MTPAQCRAARAILNAEQSEVADRAGIARATVIDFEKGIRTPRPATIAAIRAALEAAGVEFIAENGGGAGVRLKKSKE
jgi:transcriptional regulator with XRE-family HTH domain